jgi:uncharacterized membrane protein
VACLALGLLALAPVPVARPGPGDLVTLTVSGVLGVVSYVGFYRALQLGPVSLVSPCSRPMPWSRDPGRRVRRRRLTLPG